MRKVVTVIHVIIGSTSHPSFHLYESSELKSLKRFNIIFFFFPCFSSCRLLCVVYLKDNFMNAENNELLDFISNYSPNVIVVILIREFDVH